MPCFPRMGCSTFTDPPHPPGGAVSESFFVPDACINPHPRFAALVRNIRSRRGTKVDIRLPRFRDAHTPEGTPAGCPPPSTLEEALAMDEVYMDAMAFGMGCCCLQASLIPSTTWHTIPFELDITRFFNFANQVTFQARDLAESRHLYDHLAVLSPILLALTAALARQTSASNSSLRTCHLSTLLYHLLQAEPGAEQSEAALSQVRATPGPPRD